MICLRIENQELYVQEAISALDLMKKRNDFDKIYAIILNGKLHDLNYLIKENGVLELVYDHSETGHLIYERTLHFACITAVKQLYPDTNVYLQHALSNGIYGHIDKKDLSEQDIESINQKMRQMIQEQAQIIRTRVSTIDAATFFDQHHMGDKANLLRSRKSKQSSIYQLNGVYDYFYGIMLPHLGYLNHYALRLYHHGFWLAPYDHFKDQKKLFHVFQEFDAWGKQIGVRTIAQLNEAIRNGRMNELVLMCETMAEYKLHEIAEDIVNHSQARIIMIAGPSSAGKTTFSKRLAIHLKILGISSRVISMDDFYKEREACPRKKNGDYDFDCMEALDLHLLQHTMHSLMKGKPTQLPAYNFKSGLRDWHTNAMQVTHDERIIIEGIHGLNPELNAYLPATSSYKIYMNALTHLNLDAHNRIPTSDYRLLRRLARDHRTRGWNAKETISFWKNVRASEDLYIYPYQEEADMIYNSSMVYELCILKKLVIPILNEVQSHDKEYLEANRLKKLLAYFVDGTQDAVPRSSIFAEFLGNSIFDVV